MERTPSRFVSTSVFYGHKRPDNDVVVCVPPEDSDDSLLDSDSDSDILRKEMRGRTSRNIIIPESDIEDEDDNTETQIHDTSVPSTSKSSTISSRIPKRRKIVLERNNSDSEDDIPTSSKSWNRPTSHPAVQMRAPLWLGDMITSPKIFTPLEYFRMFFGNEILELTVRESNRYSVQKNPNKNLNLTVPELEIWLGIVLYMSIVKLSSTRMYWHGNYRISKVADCMTINRFEEIKSNLHFSDNFENSRKENYDRLNKVRPFLEHFISNCRVLPKCEKYSIDEQIIPFKGRSGLKQYNPKKTKKWGYKMFVLCDVKGLIYNMELYSGKDEHPPDLPNIGASGNVVLRLATVIPRGENCKVFFDNWFCSLALQSELAKLKIWSLGTVRQNRLKDCGLKSDSDMKKCGRGSTDELRCTVDNVEYSATKWYDNRSVTLLSNFAGVDPVRKVKRYDRKQKKDIEIECPNSVGEYNTFMGGVDLVDSVVAFYRTIIRSKKWYHRIFFHVLDLVCVNAWFLYRRDNSGHSHEMSLLEFKTEISLGLMKENKSEFSHRKPGRPSLKSLEGQYSEKKKRGPAAVIPISDVRLDQVGHFPIYDTKKGRCKKPNCKGIPKLKCKKCDVYLCLTSTSNCFLDFHTCL